MTRYDTIEHPEDGLPGHWETIHLPAGQRTASGYETIDIWVMHCPYHRDELLPCHICEAAGISDDEGWE